MLQRVCIIRPSVQAWLILERRFIQRVHVPLTLLQAAWSVIGQRLLIVRIIKVTTRAMREPTWASLVFQARPHAVGPQGSGQKR